LSGRGEKVKANLRGRRLTKRCSHTRSACEKGKPRGEIRMGKVLDEAEEEAQMGGLLVVCRVTAPLSHLLGSLHGEEFLVRQVVGRDHEEFRDDCRGRLNQSQGGKVGGEAF
jgi:hypothetical protein